MRGWTKALVWAVILLACAGVGAFLASRSNPFPPEVQDANPNVSPSPSGGPVVRWRLAMTSRTSHVYRVGGSCTSDWRVVTRIGVTPGGRVTGTAVARLRPGATCDFETAQVQADAVEVGIEGRRLGDLLRLRFRVLGVEPAGSQDLGGLVQTLPSIRVHLRERDGARATVATQVDDPNGDAFVSRTTLELAG